MTYICQILTRSHKYILEPYNIITYFKRFSMQLIKKLDDIIQIHAVLVVSEWTFQLPNETCTNTKNSLFCKKIILSTHIYGKFW